MEIKDKKPLN